MHSIKKFFIILAALCILPSGILHSGTNVYAAGTETVTESHRSQTEAFVERLYRIVLGRASDTAGIADWTDKLTSGAKTCSEVVYGFFFSKEYTSRNKSNEAYVTDLYAA
ncbi:MAG: DUF4214 domain-containing protein, partial [Lachnospiraceae bacterium]|nr:DUF4214 domain-containing protein [Lachnospiraceae bacterium]